MGSDITEGEELESGSENINEEFREAEDSAVGEQSQSSVFGLFVKLVSACVLISVVWLSRTDKNVNFLVSNNVLRIEKAVGIPLGPLKKLLKVEGALDTKQLFQAIENDNGLKVSMLLDAGLSANSTNEIGETALISALRWGHKEIISVLLSSGANPNTLDASGVCPIHLAVEKSNFELVEMLAESKADLEARNSAQKTPLMLAASKSDSRILQYLLLRKVNVNLQEAGGLTALSFAVLGNKVENIRFLLAAGANPKISNHEGNTVLDMLPDGSEVRVVFQQMGLVGPGSVRELAGSKVQIDPTNEQEAGSVELVSANVEDKQAQTKVPIVEEPQEIFEEDLSEEPRPVRKKMTGVRAYRRPVGVWKRSSSLTLSEVSVEVRNFGSVLAENVVVKVRIPGGKLVSLSGPVNLEPYQIATYSVSPDVKIFREGKLKEFITCDNCH